MSAETQYPVVVDCPLEDGLVRRGCEVDVTGVDDVVAGEADLVGEQGRQVLVDQESRRLVEWELSLPEGFGRRAGLRRRRRPRGREAFHDLIGRHAVGDHCHDGCYRNPQTPDAGLAAHLSGFEGDSLEFHPYERTALGDNHEAAGAGARQVTSTEPCLRRGLGSRYHLGELGPVTNEVGIDVAIRSKPRPPCVIACSCHSTRKANKRATNGEHDKVGDLPADALSSSGACHPPYVKPPRRPRSPTRGYRLRPVSGDGSGRERAGPLRRAGANGAPSSGRPGV